MNNQQVHQHHELDFEESKEHPQVFIRPPHSMMSSEALSHRQITAESLISGSNYAAAQHAQTIHRHIQTQSMAQGTCGRNCAAMCSDQADLLTQRDLIEFSRTPKISYYGASQVDNQLRQQRHQKDDQDDNMSSDYKRAK